MESPKRYLKPAIDEARRDKLWTTIDARTQPKWIRPEWKWAMGGTLVGATAALLLAVVTPDKAVSTAAPVPAGADFRTPYAQEVSTGETATTIALPDASSVQVHPHSRLRFDSDREARVLMGSADFKVTRQPEGRVFRVRGGKAVVTVIGTAFTVSHTQKETRVLVSEGLVQVEAPQMDSPLRLKAGQSWSDATEVVPPSPPAPRANPTPRPAKPGPPVQTAQTLFSEATALRGEGKFKEALVAYEHFLKKFPKNTRAGLVAFEAGRITMDQEKDPKAAARLLRQAIRLAPSSRFHEDALARLVKTLDGMGEKRACVVQQRKYAERYPQGVHRLSLQSLCK